MGLYRPLELKLDLLRIVVQLMLDGELGALRNTNPHARDLDPERLVLLQSVCKTAKLGHHLLSRVEAFDISRTPSHGDTSFRSQSAHLITERHPVVRLPYVSVSDLDAVGRWLRRQVARLTAPRLRVPVSGPLPAHPLARGGCWSRGRRYLRGRARYTAAGPGAFLGKLSEPQ